jgi:hypothetical protein
MTVTPRLGLALLSAGQAQKEFFHNEALHALDLLVAAAVEEPPRASPPTSPALGATYIVATSPSGAWAGYRNNVAGFTSGGWRYLPPFDGMSAYLKSDGSFAVYRGGTWELGLVRGSAFVVDGQQIVGHRAAVIGDPIGGSTIDTQARAAIVQLLGALRQHGLIET